MSLEAVRRLAWTAIVLFIMAIVFAFNLPRQGFPRL